MADHDPHDSPADPTRRRWLAGVGGGLGLTAAGWLAPPLARAGDNRPPHTPEWMQRLGFPVGDRPYGRPSTHEGHVIRRMIEGLNPDPHSTASFTPLGDLHGSLTPNGLVFERHHAGVPDIDPREHRLMVHGMVERSLILTMDDLLRFPAVSRVHFLECGANSVTERAGPNQSSVQFTHGMLANCEWTGVPLRRVLDEAGLHRGAKWVLAEGADAAGMTRSIPLDASADDALLVYAQNGERLRPEQGYPLRLVMPGLEGNLSVKWLRRLKVGDQPWMTREETSKYTDLQPDGLARQFTLLMEAKSVITHPSAGHRLEAKGFHEIRGLAWSGSGRVKSVEVSVDGGRHWHTATLHGPVLPKALTRFSLPWEWRGEPAWLQSRVWDESGYLQPTPEQLVAARGTLSIYHYNAIQTWHVDRHGEVTNDRA